MNKILFKSNVSFPPDFNIYPNSYWTIRSMFFFPRDSIIWIVLEKWLIAALLKAELHSYEGKHNSLVAEVFEQKILKITRNNSQFRMSLVVLTTH